MTGSAILYQNESQTVFLIDIPTSIALAQSLSTQTTPRNAPPSSNHKTSSPQPQPGPRRRQLLSSPALEKPYPPSTEPKSAAARARVLQRIPHSEREIADAIEPVVLGALGEIRSGHQRGCKWCFPRGMVGDSDDGKTSAKAGGVMLRKRRKRKEGEEVGDDQEDQLTFDNTDLQSLGSEQSFETTTNQPPLILSPGANRFKSGSELRNHIVKNTSAEIAIVEICHSYLNSTSNNSIERHQREHEQPQTYIVPPLSKFVICDLPISTPSTHKSSPIPGLSSAQKFNLILLDPPWSNRSVRRSRNYQTQAYSDSDLLTESICNVLRVHSYSHFSAAGGDRDTAANLKVEVGKGEEEGGAMPDICIGAIWITNSAKARKTAYDALRGAGFIIAEEWVWIKTTVYGAPVTPVDGLWRKPYEALVVGLKKQARPDSPASGLVEESAQGIRRRVIAAVPDLHSRKPNLREVFESVFFSSLFRSGNSEVRYEALEVFARNLTAGWWACGNEVLKFNDGEWWVEGDY
ncbi:hypothetical protein BJY01DRAFT_64217 [Aspergillus pseudoustus]|uniref:MT-A70-domain-containing protein n=1 Tax=Aspergillus pseudoustus TaxID=1810923 RepID=A0ABR4KMD0_9EURO